MGHDITEEKLKELSVAAWKVRDRARLYGKTQVGCAVLDENGRIHIGCNIEHRFRSHDIHAEVNAISTLIAAGGTTLRAVMIAAERERFTPCGSCMDWIFELGDSSTVIIFERASGDEQVVYTANQLMPHYPL